MDMSDLLQCILQSPYPVEGYHITDYAVQSVIALLPARIFWHL